MVNYQTRHVHERDPQNDVVVVDIDHVEVQRYFLLSDREGRFDAEIRLGPAAHTSELQRQWGYIFNLVCHVCMDPKPEDP